MNALQERVDLMIGRKPRPTCSCGRRTYRVGPYWLCTNLGCRTLVVEVVR